MTVTVNSRRAHQLQVAALLDELEERRRQLNRRQSREIGHQAGREREVVQIWRLGNG